MTPSGRVSPACALTALLVLGAVVVAYAPTLSLGHLGHDTFPMILTSRVESPQDLLGSFTEELMDGRYPEGRFYRPVANLSLALDHALFGLEPRGYQLHNFSVLLAASVAVFALGLRVLSHGWAALLAAGVFALSPLQLEVLPVTSRRPELLSVMFCVLALLALPPPGSSRRVVRALGVAIFTLLAGGAKETGLIAAPLVLVLATLESGGAPRKRLRAVLAGAGPALAAAALLVLARLWVLDGSLGGHPESMLLGGLDTIPELFVSLAVALALPQPVAPPATTSLGVLTQLIALFAVTGFASRAGRRDRPAGPPGNAGWLAAFWVAGLLGLSGASGRSVAWYAVWFLPAFGLLLGVAVCVCLRALRARRWIVGALVGLLGVGVAAPTLRYSPLLERYEQWPRLSQEVETFLLSVENVLSVARPGERLVVHDMPLGLSTERGSVGLRSAAGIDAYSVQAWSELARPGLVLRVARSSGRLPPPPNPGEVALGLVPRSADR